MRRSTLRRSSLVHGWHGALNLTRSFAKLGGCNLAVPSMRGGGREASTPLSPQLEESYWNGDTSATHFLVLPGSLAMGCGPAARSGARPARCAAAGDYPHTSNDSTLLFRAQ
jgi:hypothetical protein